MTNISLAQLEPLQHFFHLMILKKKSCWFWFLVVSSSTERKKFNEKKKNQKITGVTIYPTINDNSYNNRIFFIQKGMTILFFFPIQTCRSYINNRLTDLPSALLSWFFFQNSLWWWIWSIFYIYIGWRDRGREKRD